MKKVADELILIRALQDVAERNKGAWEGAIANLIGYNVDRSHNRNVRTFSRRLNALEKWAQAQLRPRECFTWEGNCASPPEHCLQCRYGLTITHPKRGSIRIEFKEADNG